MVVNICWSVVMYIQYVIWQKTVALLVAVKNKRQLFEKRRWNVGF